MTHIWIRVIRRSPLYGIYECASSHDLSILSIRFLCQVHTQRKQQQPKAHGNGNIKLYIVTLNSNILYIFAYVLIFKF